MWEYFVALFDPSGFPPRWRCGTGWTPQLGWLHILSDLGVWSAYVAIPVVLGFFAARRRDIPFRSVFLLFVAFILLCGLTHLLEAIIFWWPVYRLSGVVKLLTAGVSWWTVVALARVTPQALSLRSPRELERQVAERTAAVTASNAALTAEMAERQRAEDARRESEEQFRTLADSIPQLAWTARPDGHIDWYNRRWYEYTGTVPGEMEGWGWQDVHDPEVLPKVLERWKASIATGEPFEMVFPIRGGDGRFCPFLTRVVPLRGSDGRILRWFGTNTDVTAIQAMEAELKEADRRKDQFLAMLAHELRNPLAPLVNGLHILRQPDLGPQAADAARRMMDRQIGHMTRLVDDLLDVSRVTRGKVSLRTGRINLARMTRIAVEDHRPAFDKAGLSLTFDPSASPVWVEGDPTRLTQVAGNLLQNALKYTGRGGHVVVGVAVEGDDAVIRVRDTGIGLDPELLPRLFDAFVQADRSLDRSQGGLGLGLALVKGLVVLHGGRVSATSPGPGRGAEFVVSLPRASAPSVRVEVPESRPSSPRPLRVLVVEDQADAAESLRLVLEAAGHEVAVAGTGPAGVDAARGLRPDAVLCDIGLPGGMSGYDVARMLKSDPATAGCRRIALTGYGQPEDHRKSQEAGFEVLLVKPVSPDALLNLLSQS